MVPPNGVSVFYAWRTPEHGAARPGPAHADTLEQVNGRPVLKQRYGAHFGQECTGLPVRGGRPPLVQTERSIKAARLERRQVRGCQPAQHDIVGNAREEIGATHSRCWLAPESNRAMSAVQCQSSCPDPAYSSEAFFADTTIPLIIAELKPSCSI